MFGGEEFTNLRFDDIVFFDAHPHKTLCSVLGDISGQVIDLLAGKINATLGSDATDFSAGDLVLTRDVDPATLQPGDIIAFTSTNSESYGQVVTHKIRSLTTTASGDPGFITYGTTTDTDDEAVVSYTDVLGKYSSRLPGVGRFFNFLKTTPGYILCIFVPFALLILSQSVETVRIFRRYKREQMEELQQEKAQLAEERRQSAAMLAELQALRAQLGMKDDAPSPTPDDHPSAEEKIPAERDS